MHTRLAFSALLMAGAACLLVIAASLASAARPPDGAGGITRSFLNDAGIVRQQTAYPWLHFDAADFRASDAFAAVDRVSLSGAVWQGDAPGTSAVWRVRHTGQVIILQGRQVILHAPEPQPLTVDEITVRWTTDAPYVPLIVSLETDVPRFDGRAQRVEFGIYEPTAFGWRLLPPHRLLNAPQSPTPDQIESLRHAATRDALSRWALAGLIACALGLAGLGAVQVRVWRSQAFWLAVLVFALALGVRYVVAAERAQHDRQFYAINPASDNYVRMARETLAGSESHIAGAFFSPGNTIWFTLWSVALAPDLDTLYTVNLITGALSVALLALLACRLSHAVGGAVAGAVGALFPLLAFYHTTLQIAAPLSAGVALALWLGVLAIQTRRPRYSALFGLTLGALGLLRANSLILGLAFAIGYWLGGGDRRQAAGQVALAAVCALAVILPQTWANHAVGTPWLINGNGAETLYWGTNRDGNGSGEIGTAWFIAPTRGLSYTEALLEDLRTEPFRLAQLTLHKWGLLWSQTDIANNVDYTPQGLGASGMLRALSLGGLIGAPALILAGLAGMIALRPLATAPGARAFLVSAFVLLTLATLLFTVFGRMRVPLYPILCVALGVAGAQGWQAWRARIDRVALARRWALAFGIAGALLIASQVAKFTLPVKPFFVGDLPAAATVHETPLADDLTLRGMELLGYACDAPTPHLFVRLYWRTDAPAEQAFSVQFQVERGTTHLPPRGFQRIGTISYPPRTVDQWRAGDTLGERYLVILPPGLLADTTPDPTDEPLIVRISLHEAGAGRSATLAHIRGTGADCVVSFAPDAHVTNVMPAP